MYMYTYNWTKKYVYTHIHRLVYLFLIIDAYMDVHMYNYTDTDIHM